MLQIFNVCKAMFKYRGWKCEQDTSKWEMIMDVYDTENNLVKLLFIDNVKITLNFIKDYLNYLETNNIYHSIIIHKYDFTSGCLNIIKKIKVRIYIELFSYLFMRHDIMTHRLVPKHEKIDKDEYNWVSNKYGTHLPILLLTDPVVRFLNFKENDIIKIYRPTSITYRIVKSD